MSLLPQRKKSAGEIAKLREELGIAGLPREDDVPADEPEPPPPAAAIPEPREQPSPRKSGSVPVLLPESPEEEPQDESARPLPKPVRSLRKSEREPSPATTRKSAAGAANSKIPAHRHSDRDIEEIRKREALGALQSPNAPAAYFQSLLAPLPLVLAGYLSAIAGAACAAFDADLKIAAACEVLALGIALHIHLKKKLSRHHAAFILIAALLVIAFGALHYFPHLRNAS